MRKNYRSTIPGFEKEDYCCKVWGDIRVPAHIRWKAMINRSMPMSSTPGRAAEEVKPGEIPEEFNPVASYVKYFEVPSSMKEKKISSPSGERRAAWPSGSTGKFVGYSEDSFTRPSLN